MAKKIPNHLDDPFDNIMNGLCDKLAPWFKQTGHTPNTITTYSLITGLLACYALYKNAIVPFLVLFVISYFFDCFDGYFARRYGMTSKFGDFYDHIKDAVVYIILIFIIFKKYRSVITPANVVIIAVLFILFTIHMGCQQTYYKHLNKDAQSETIDAYQKMCRDKDDLKYTRFFGPGMMILFSAILIVWIWYKASQEKKKKK
jgi:phosphatidylglycerophosphate synthase